MIENSQNDLEIYDNYSHIVSMEAIIALKEGYMRAKLTISYIGAGVKDDCEILWGSSNANFAII